VSVLKSYRCHKVTGDRYGGEFPREQFRKRGITYNVSERVKSDIYVDFLPLLNSGRVMLPRNEKLVRQLCSLERTTVRGSGKDTIDHPRDRGMHDDVANAVAGAAVLAGSFGGYNLELLRKVTALGSEDEDIEARNRQYRAELAARIYALSGGQYWPR
jgi:hypothetical protein